MAPIFLYTIMFVCLFVFFISIKKKQKDKKKYKYTTVIQKELNSIYI